MGEEPDEGIEGAENPLIADFILYRGLRRGGELSESMLRAFGAVCVSNEWPVFVLIQPWTIEVHVREEYMAQWLDELYDIVQRASWSEGRRIHAVFRKYYNRHAEGEILPWQN